MPKMGQIWLPLPVSSPPAGVSENNNEIDFSLVLENGNGSSGMAEKSDLLPSQCFTSRVHALLDEAAGRCGCAELALLRSLDLQSRIGA